MNHPLFEVVKTTTGVASILNKNLGEIMHNPVGPWLEANSLYIDQSDLEQKLQQNTLEELVIFDVGLGAAANALAVLHKAVGMPRPIRIISFEKNLDLLEYALVHSNEFEHFSGFETAIQTLLSSHIWTTSNISWELRHGDFCELISREKYFAHFIYYDPYSPQMNREMWTLECFKKLREKCRDNGTETTNLYTYSRATPIRSALLAAGFFVGSGIATGLKDETTQACTRLSDLTQPLGERWLSRWKNSHTRYPFDCLAQDESLFTESILGHPQFRNFT